MAAAAIEIDGLTKRFGSRVAVDGVSLEVAPGELLVLLGGSGSGKTTLLKMVNRLVAPTAGRVRIAGEDTLERPPHELRRRIGYCFQEIGLFPHLTVAENVALPAALAGWPAARVRSRVRELLRLVELDPDEHGGRLPATLSGGQRQRVGVARALAAAPPIVLFDEPFGALDPLTRDRLQAVFRRLRAELGLTGIFVTHDVLEALRLADRIAVLDGGRLRAVGPPRQLLARPPEDPVRQLLESPRRQAARVASLFEERETGGAGA